MDRRNFLTLGAIASAVPALTARVWAAPARATDAASYSAERRFVALPQGDIAYVDRGHGPGALFLHGFPVNGYQWRGALDRLSGRRRCIVPDFMGLGYSVPAPDQDLRAPAQVAMLVALLDKLGVERVDLVANDSGCAVAQLLVAHHGNRIRTMLLTNGDTEPDCPPAAIRSVVAAARAGTFADTFRPWIENKALCREAGQLGGDTFTFPARLKDETIDMYLRPLAARSALTNAYGLAADDNPLAGSAALLRHAAMPVRVVWGTGDTIFQATAPDYLSALFPRSQGVRRIPGAKLFFPEEFSDLIANELTALWQV